MAARGDDTSGAPALSVGQGAAFVARSIGGDMSDKRWTQVPYLDALRPDYGWTTQLALMASYSADLVTLVAALLALAGVDDDRGSGSKVDFAHAIDRLSGKVRLVVQAGRLVTPNKSPKILG